VQLCAFLFCSFGSFGVWCGARQRGSRYSVRYPVPGYVTHKCNHRHSWNRTERGTLFLTKLKILEESAINSSYWAGMQYTLSSYTCCWETDNGVQVSSGMSIITPTVLVSFWLSLCLSAFTLVGELTFPIWENKFKHILKFRSYVYRTTYLTWCRRSSDASSVICNPFTCWATSKTGRPVCCL
jgi:hypothetical protein